MAKQKGRLFLIKISDGAGTFASFTGLTGRSLKVNNERIDATTSNPVDPGGAFWRETLDGVKSVSLSGDGTLVKDASEARLWEIAMSTAAEDDFQVVVPGVGMFEGRFSVEVELSEDGKVTFSMSMESTGEITFTAEA